MSKLWVLLRLELRSLYGLNTLRYTKDPAAKKRGRCLLLVWAILIAMAAFYVGGLVYGLCTLGLAAIVPAYLTVVASLLILAFGLFSAGHRLFGDKGYDLLASLPVRPGHIVLSRFLGLYLADWLFTLLVWIPGMAVYGALCHPPLWWYPLALVGTLAIPAVPLVISVLFGSLVLAVSARMKKRSLVQTGLTVLLVVGIMLVSFTMDGATESFTAEQFTSLATVIGEAIRRLYPPAMWLGEGLDGHPGYYGLFLLLSAGVTAGALYLLSRCFSAIQRRLLTVSATHSYKMGEMTHRGLLKALYLREAKRYFSSGVYVTNTVIGPIMGTVMAVALCVTGVEALQAAIPLDVKGAVPFIFAAVSCMMTTTSTSISMEGRPVWAVKSLPIPTKALLDSKLLLNLSLMAPFYAVSSLLFTVALKPALLEALWLWLIPLCMALFSTVFGLTVNLASHSFDWEQEAAVVKQSLPAAVGGFVPVVVSLLLGLVALSVPAGWGHVVKGLVALLLLGVTWLLYRRNNRVTLSSL